METKIESYSDILSFSKGFYEKFSIISSCSSAKKLSKYFRNKIRLYELFESLKLESVIIYFRYHFEYETFQFVFPISADLYYIAVLSNKSCYLSIFKKNSLIEFYKVLDNNFVNDFVFKRLIFIFLLLDNYRWKDLEDIDIKELDHIKSESNLFFESFMKDELTDDNSDIEFEFENILEEFLDHDGNFNRFDLHPHDYPQFSTRKKPQKSIIPISSNLKSISTPIEKLETIYKFKNFFSILNDQSNSWFERYLALKSIEIQLEYKENRKIDSYSKILDEEFNLELRQLQLVDGYGEKDEFKLKELVDSIIHDKLANRSSNKLIVGPQGTGKSSFAILLSNLMKSKLIVLECGPLSDNSDFYGSYEIHVDKETRQAVTSFTYNGFMYASKLVEEGHKVVIAVEEYNLLPSETLLKQLNRFFQDRIISSMGGRHEIDNNNKKGDLVIILTGNHEFNQDWIEDVGLARRFEFFELPLPSTSSVSECLFKYVQSPIINKSLSLDIAERIAEIRDDLVASLKEKSIRPILSKEIKFPDLFTLRNFAMDLIHGVQVEKATKRWIIKIILGGIPLDEELRQEYNDYAKIIIRTVEDRLPENLNNFLVSL